MPKLDPERARFVLAKIDQILEWEQNALRERDTKFVALGRYLCEVRAGQYWRVEHLKSFDEFLEQRFPESRRKAYYLMSIHEQLQRVLRRDAWACQWCGSRTELQVHHLTHRCQQGHDVDDNMVTLCNPCHRAAHGQYRNG